MVAQVEVVSVTALGRPQVRYAPAQTTDICHGHYELTAHVEEAAGWVSGIAGPCHGVATYHGNAYMFVVTQHAEVEVAGSANITYGEMEGRTGPCGGQVGTDVGLDVGDARCFSFALGGLDLTQQVRFGSGLDIVDGLATYGVRSCIKSQAEVNAKGVGGFFEAVKNIASAFACAALADVGPVRQRNRDKNEWKWKGDGYDDIDLPEHKLLRAVKDIDRCLALGRQPSTCSLATEYLSTINLASGHNVWLICVVYINGRARAVLAP